jgi:hypothetical protein
MASLTVHCCCSVPKALGSRESILVEHSALGALSSGTANWGRAFLFSTSNLPRAFSSVKEPALRCHEPCPSSLLHSKAQIPHRPFVPHRLTAGSPMLRHYAIRTPVLYPRHCTHCSTQRERELRADHANAVALILSTDRWSEALGI